MVVAPPTHDAPQGPDRIIEPLRRGIATTLSLLDEALCLFERSAGSAAVHGVRSYEVNARSGGDVEAISEASARSDRSLGCSATG